MLPYILLIIAVASHALPHPWWNFTAVCGALLVWGARRPVISWVLPVAVLAASDWFLTRVVYSYPFHVAEYLVTWAWYAFAMLLGFLLLRERPGVGRSIVAAVFGPTSFFVVSNYAVWANPASWYPHTAAGIVACYTAALPFYRNDVLSTALVVGLVWGVPAVWRRYAPDGAVSHATR